MIPGARRSAHEGTKGVRTPRARVVLFGGRALSQSLDDTWEWDGTRWSERFPKTRPPERVFHALAYDDARSAVVLFGGTALGGALLPDTWEYGPVHPASYATSDPGCAGSAGVPTLGAAADQRPWLGESFRVEITNLPPSTVALLHFGASKTTWGPLALPLRLDPLGAPGCRLAASGEWSLPLAVVGGAASLTMPVPDDPGLAGRSFY